MKSAYRIICAILLFGACCACAEESADEIQAASILEIARNAGFMEYIILAVSVAGFALALQALVSLRAPLLRPPELADELAALAREGDIANALQIARDSDSLLGTVAAATLQNAPYGPMAMEGAMADVGELESGKLFGRLGVLQLIAAIAPMLGLTGTTVGMIMTFAVIAANKECVTASDMAQGIAVALVCTFTGLMVAIPLLAISFFLKARVQQTVLEVSNDCNELVRIIAADEPRQEVR